MVVQISGKDWTKVIKIRIDFEKRSKKVLSADNGNYEDSLEKGCSAQR